MIRKVTKKPSSLIKFAAHNAGIFWGAGTGLAVTQHPIGMIVGGAVGHYAFKKGSKYMKSKWQKKKKQFMR